MHSLMRLFGSRVVPEHRTVRMEQRRGSLEMHYALGQPDSYIFTADVYGYAEHSHPDGHLGWWRFELPAGRGRATLEMRFEEVEAASVHVTVDGTRLSPIDSWCNPAYAFAPLGDLQLVIRDGSGDIQRIEPVLLKFVDRDILLDFYRRQYASEGYTPARSHPFLWELHAYKLQRLRDLFSRYIPGGNVVDVGCGRSLFTEIDESFPFTVYAGDLNFDSVHARAAEIRHQKWGVFDASALPFGDRQFDALFAGEVIEHVPDVRESLREWRRVLKPGGVAIITTPNRERLVALAHGCECPVSPDHLSELSYRELTRDLLPDCGFEFVAQSCIYLELWLQNLFNGFRVQDYLQRGGNTPQHVGAMRRLFPLGSWLPWASLAMVVVARRA